MAEGSPAYLLPDFLARRAERTPGALALRWSGGDVSYGELADRAASAAGALRALGVSAGDRLAVLGPGPLDFAVLLHGLMRLGAAVVPLNTRLRPQELRPLLADARPRALVAGESCADTARAIAREVGVPCRVLAEGAALAGDPLPAPDLPAETVAAVLYTSGTTGPAKGALLTRGNFFHAAVASSMGLGALPQDRWLLCMPLFHVGGLSILLRSTLFGGAVLALDGFDVPTVARALAGDAPTAVSLVPVMLERLLSAHVAPPPSLRFALVGGGPATRDLLERAIAAGWPVASTYGLTETASQAATLPPWDARGHIGSAGRPLFLTEIRIVRDGRTAEAGQAGEICVRGPTVGPGYLGRATDPARGPDGWLATGDVGYLDGDGYLYVLDRRDDLIVSGGENVYPAEVEAVLMRHPGVADAAVYPVADPVWGQVPAAAVVPGGTPPSREELLDFLRGELAGYKVPREIRFLPELPRNAAGKLVRSALRRGGPPA